MDVGPKVQLPCTTFASGLEGLNTPKAARYLKFNANGVNILMTEAAKFNQIPLVKQLVASWHMSFASSRTWGHVKAQTFILLSKLALRSSRYYLWALLRLESGRQEESTTASRICRIRASMEGQIRCAGYLSV